MVHADGARGWSTRISLNPLCPLPSLNALPFLTSPTTPLAPPGASWLGLGWQGRSQYGERVQREWAASKLDKLVDELLLKNPANRLACDERAFKGLQDHAFFAGVDWPVVEMRKWASPLKWEWYRRENDLAMSRQFRNGEDLTNVVDKLQSLVLEEGDGTGPGAVPDWDFVNPRAVYREYVSSPYLNYKLPLQF